METKIRKEIPEEIKKFNWGAFLLTTFWTIRHGLWGSLFLSWIPIFGWIIMPFILGFRGNVWAWQKNDYPSTTQFLKTQSRWGLAGFLTWPLFIGSMCGFYIYALNFSDSIKMAIEISNHNDRVIDYFGSPIKKVSWWGSMEYSSKLYPELTTLSVKFDAQGTKNQGEISMRLVKQADTWVMLDLKLRDQNYNTIPIIQSHLSTSTETYEFPDATQIRYLLTHEFDAQTENKYLHYYRSKSLGDYMLIRSGSDDRGKQCLTVSYEDSGITHSTAQYFEYHPCIKNKKEVEDILFNYAMGMDHFKKDIHWRLNMELLKRNYESAANQGDADAQNNLGFMYLKGDGIDKDAKRAIVWFEKAANQGNATAQHNLGFMYLKGEGVEKDAKCAIGWFEKAANQGNARSQYNLGIIYLKGEGVEKDAKRAVVWFEKAENQGDARAQYNLGVMYLQGEGVEKDVQKAAIWFEKSANQGDVYAQNNLGLMYLKGEGVEKNKEQALIWFEKAANQGYEQAKYNLEKCMERN
jgi:TPR repeat protein